MFLRHIEGLGLLGCGGVVLDVSLLDVYFGGHVSLDLGLVGLGVSFP